MSLLQKLFKKLQTVTERLGDREQIYKSEATTVKWLFTWILANQLGPSPDKSGGLVYGVPQPLISVSLASGDRTKQLVM